jgi:membrane protein YqaA with SNARE-associated domain
VFGELKDWTVSLVLTPPMSLLYNAYMALWGVAFAESSFFPIPPDIPFILMGIAQPSVFFVSGHDIDLWVGSGGGIGYAIGLYGGRPLVEYLVSHRWLGHLFTHEKFEMVESFYQRYDVWAVLIAAFTPIPYKVFTIGGGLCRIRFWRFMLVSLVGRSGRFFSSRPIALLFWRSGAISPQAFRSLFDRNDNPGDSGICRPPVFQACEGKRTGVSPCILIPLFLVIG